MSSSRSEEAERTIVRPKRRAAAGARTVHGPTPRRTAARYDRRPCPSPRRGQCRPATVSSPSPGRAGSPGGPGRLAEGERMRSARAVPKSYPVPCAPPAAPAFARPRAPPRPGPATPRRRGWDPCRRLWAARGAPDGQWSDSRASARRRGSQPRRRGAAGPARTGAGRGGARGSAGRAAVRRCCTAGVGLGS